MRLFKRFDNFSGLAADFLVDIVPADTSTVLPREHDEIPTGNRQVGGQGWAFRTNPFLDDLNVNDVTFLQAILNRRTLATGGLFADLLFLGFTRKVFLVQVGDVEKSNFAMTKVNKRGLDGRLNVGHPPAVNVAHAGGGGWAFGKEVIKTTAPHNRDACLLTWIVIDEHDGFVRSRFGLGHRCLLSVQCRSRERISDSLNTDGEEGTRRTRGGRESSDSPIKKLVSCVCRGQG